MNLVSMFASSTDCISSCGTNVCIPSAVAGLTSTIIFIIKVVVPVLLVLWGMLDFAKSVIAKNEDDVKKYRKNFIQRVISAIVVFFLVFVVQLVINLVASVEDTTNDQGQTVSDIWSCSKKFINGVNN